MMTHGSDPFNDKGPVGGDDQAAVPELPARDDRPGLVDAAELRKRLDAIQASIQKSVLALLAIVAFWLAIENSYHRFATLVNERQVQALLSNQLLSTTRKIDAATVAQAAIRARPPEKQSDTDLEAIARLLRQMEQERAQIEAGKEKNKEQIARLQQEPLDLSIVGTKITSRLVVAPLLCLVAFLFWLNFVAARRSMAHGHLAALHARLGAAQLHFGAAAHGSMWIAPLPLQVQIRAGGERAMLVNRADLRWLLGWTPLTEQRQVRALRIFTLLCAAITLRIGFIATDLTSAAAVDARFISAAWQWPAAILAVAVTVVCVVKLLFLTLAGSGDVDGAEVPMPARRELIANAAALSLVAVVGAYLNHDRLLKAGRTLLAGIGPSPSSGKSSLRPRFVAAAERSKRLAHRNVMRSAPAAAVLVYVPPRRPDTFTVHAANREGKVLLRAAASRAPGFKVASVEQISTWLRTPPSIGTLNARYSWPFEVNALLLVEAGKVVEAREVLSLGVRLTLSNQPGTTVNWRLLDLLAGLAVRSRSEDRFLAPLMDQVGAYQARLEKSGILQAAAAAAAASSGGVHRLTRDAARTVKASVHAAALRRTKWKPGVSSPWRTKWSDPTKPVWWHHPVEPRTEPLPARKVAAAERTASSASAAAPAQGDWRASLGLRKGDAALTRKPGSGHAQSRQRPVRIA